MDPVDLEQRGRQALATSGEAAAAFYRDVLDVDVAMLLPGGTLLEGRENALRFDVRPALVRLPA